MTGNSTPAQGGVTDDPIKIGTMLYTLVEPHRGHEVDYNRWYEHKQKARVDAPHHCGQ